MKKITCCPHCGSEAGFHTKADYIGVPYKYDFNGEGLNNIEMYDNADKVREHKYVFCNDCGEKICTLERMFKQLEK